MGLVYLSSAGAIPGPSVGGAVPLRGRIRQGAMRNVRSTAIVVFSGALASSLAMWVFTGLIDGFSADTFILVLVTYGAMGLVVLIAVQFARALRLGTTEVLAEPPRQLVGRGPMAAIAAARNRALAMGLSWGLFTLVIAALVTPLVWQIGTSEDHWLTVAGLAVAVAFTAAFVESTPWLYYHWLRRRLAREGLIPRDLRGFLDWCAEPGRGWLRASDAYEFRHRELLEHLAYGRRTPDEALPTVRAAG